MLTPDSATFESALRRLNPTLGERETMEIMGGVIVSMKTAADLFTTPQDLEASLREISEGLLKDGPVKVAPVPVVIVRKGTVIVRWQ